MLQLLQDPYPTYNLAISGLGVWFLYVNQIVHGITHLPSHSTINVCHFHCSHCQWSQCILRVVLRWKRIAELSKPVF